MIRTSAVHLDVGRRISAEDSEDRDAPLFVNRFVARRRDLGARSFRELGDRCAQEGRAKGACSEHRHGVRAGQRDDHAPEQILERAIKLYDKKDYFSASIELKKVLDGESGDDAKNKQRAEFFMGKTLYQMGFYAGSLALLRQDRPGGRHAHLSRRRR